MAFTSTITDRSKMATKNVTWGTFTNDGGSTGGDVNTGLTVCDGLYLIKNGDAVDASQYAVNETLPVAGSAVTIVTTADVSGYWWAFGR